MESGGSTAVEHLPRHYEVKGSSPASPNGSVNGKKIS
jgi:hypothetical protein